MKKWFLFLTTSLLILPLWGCAKTEEPEVALNDPAELYALFDAALTKSGSMASQSFSMSVRQTNPVTGEEIREVKSYAVFLSGNLRRIEFCQDRRIGEERSLFRKVVDETPAGTFTEYYTTDSQGTRYRSRPYGYDLDLNTYFADFYEGLPAVIAQYGIRLSNLLDHVGITRNDSFRQGDSVHIDVGFATEGEEAEFRATLEDGYLVYAWFSNQEEYHILAQYWVGECPGIDLPSAEE